MTKHEYRNKNGRDRLCYTPSNNNKAWALYAVGDSPDIKMTELSDGTLLFASFTVRVDLIEVAGSRS